MGRRTFIVIEVMFGIPFALMILLVFAVGALTSSSGRPIGVVLAVASLGLIYLGLKAAYSATVDPDGTITFRSLTRKTITTLAQISRIGWQSNGRGANWVFYFDGGSVRLPNLAGRSLAQLVVSVNPSVDYPPRLANRLQPRIPSPTTSPPGWWLASDGKWYPPEATPGWQQPPGPS